MTQIQSKTIINCCKKYVIFFQKEDITPVLNSLDELLTKYKKEETKIYENVTFKKYYNDGHPLSGMNFSEKELIHNFSSKCLYGVDLDKKLPNGEKRYNLAISILTKKNIPDYHGDGPSLEIIYSVAVTTITIPDILETFYNAVKSQLINNEKSNDAFPLLNYTPNETDPFYNEIIDIQQQLLNKIYIAVYPSTWAIMPNKEIPLAQWDPKNWCPKITKVIRKGKTKILTLTPLPKKNTHS